MRGGVQAPERWAGAQGVPRPVFWGASLATFDCGKKDGGGARAWTPRPFPPKLPLTPASAEAPEPVFFTLLEVSSSLALPPNSAAPACGLPGALPMTGTDSPSSSSAKSNGHGNRTAKGNA